MKGNRPYNNVPPRPQLELQNRKILFGITGGIAAYKSAELCRLFVKAGAKVQVIMTEAAAKFVAPLTFETITGRDVYMEMFPAQGAISPWHTELASWADIAVIAPATANHMAKLAHGLADDLLSTLMLTVERPRVICPAMNPRMWANTTTQLNLATLKRVGYRVMMPDDGQMARPGEEEGIGRLADPQAIYREIRHILSAPQDLRGVRVLVTAGRTEESWDPVRVLTNRASGRMGFALAEEARERGAEVMLIHGPTDVIPPTGVRLQKITTASEMAQHVRREFQHCNILLMSAAVADYTFSNTAEHKIKKGVPDSEMKLVATEDILRSISSNKGSRIIVGFALETENLLENALKKLREKHLDVVVANNPLERGSGFAGDTNQVMIIHRTGRVQDLPLQSKREVAREILNAVIAIYRHPEPEPEVEPDFDLEPDLDVDDETDAIDFGRVDALDEDDLDIAEVAPHSPKADSRPHMAVDSRDDRAETRSSRRRRNKKKRFEQRAGQPQPTTPSTPKPAPVVPPVAAVAQNGHQPEKLAPTISAVAAVSTSEIKPEKKSRRGGRRVKEREAKKAAAREQQQTQMPLEPLPRPRVTVRPAPQKAPTPVAAASVAPPKPAVAAAPPPTTTTPPAKKPEEKKPVRKAAEKPKAKVEKPAEKAKPKAAVAKKPAAKKPVKKKTPAEA